jgi:hypothetical protein
MPRFKVRRPSPALVIAFLALFAAMGGSAVAATKLIIHTRNIADGAVTNPKLRNGAVSNSKLNGQLRSVLASQESSRFCTPTLCIDADPASGGSGGWGFNSEANRPVTQLKKGHSYPFTVTIVQDATEYADGSITLTWNPTDFVGPTAGSDPSATCSTASTGNAVSCTYTDLSHQDKSDSFTFKARAVNPHAQVGVTVQVNGEQASALFPVAIVR